MYQVMPSLFEKDLNVRGDGQVIKKYAPMDNFKLVSRRANSTLTSFTNEMSEILRQSIERLDDINFKMRGFDFGENSFSAGNCDKNIPPLLAEEKPAPPKVLTPITEVKKEKKLSTGRNVRKGVRKANISNGVTTTSKKGARDSVVALSFKQEAAVMSKIKLQHKRLGRKNPQKETDQKTTLSPPLEPIDSTLKLLRERYTERPRFKGKRKQSVEVFHPRNPRTLRARKSQNINSCYVNKKFDDQLWFGPKLSAEIDQNKKEVKTTKLARKYASENFHDKRTRDRPLNNDCGLSSKGLRISPDKNDWCVIMQTHKPTIPKYELKQNSPLGVNNILDDVTLKDLEPLKAEYPRKDNLIEMDSFNLQDTLLYKLVNDDVHSLEYLIDIRSNHSIDTTKKKNPLKKRTLRQNVETIPEEKNTCGDDMLPSPRQQIERMLVEKRPNINYKDYQMYKKISKKEAKRRLNKFLVDPAKKVRNFIVMPVLVQLDRPITPHIMIDKRGAGEQINEVEKAKSEDLNPEIVLAPYIHMGDHKIEPKPTPTTIMTMTVQQGPAQKQHPDKMQNKEIKPVEKHVRLPEEESVTRCSTPVNRKTRVKTKTQPNMIREAVTMNEQKLKPEPRNTILNNIEREMQTLLANMKGNEADEMSLLYSRAAGSKNVKVKKPEKEEIDLCVNGIGIKKPERSRKTKKAEKSYDSFKNIKNTAIIPEKLRPQSRSLSPQNLNSKLKAEPSLREIFKKRQAGPPPNVTSEVMKKAMHKWQELEDPSFHDEPSLTSQVEFEDMSILDKPSPILQVMTPKAFSPHNAQTDISITSEPSAPVSASQVSPPSIVSQVTAHSNVITLQVSPYPKVIIPSQVSAPPPLNVITATKITIPQCTSIPQVFPTKVMTPRQENDASRDLSPSRDGKDFPHCSADPEINTVLSMYGNNPAQFEMTLSEETRKFCEQVTQVIQEVKQQVNVEPPVVMKPVNLLEAKKKEPEKMRSSEEFLTPFMHAVKNYRRQDYTHNFLEYLDGLGLNRSYTLIRTASKIAAVKHIKKEEYLIQNMGHIMVNRNHACNWTESDLNVHRYSLDPLEELEYFSTYVQTSQECVAQQTTEQTLDNLTNDLRMTKGRLMDIQRIIPRKTKKKCKKVRARNRDTNEQTVGTTEDSAPNQRFKYSLQLW